jgi:hypothetical protein
MCRAAELAQVQHLRLLDQGFGPDGARYVATPTGAWDRNTARA